MIKKTYYAACDQCEEADMGTASPSYNDAEQEARRQGWKIIRRGTGRVYLCPRCAAERKGEK